MRIVFVGPAGKPPVDQPAKVGQIAVNQTTNEKWFVNSKLQWQRTQGK
jgi:hypothetical protein